MMDIHAEIFNLLQRIETETGVRVESISTRWIDTSSMSESRASLAMIELETKKFSGHPK